MRQAQDSAVSPVYNGSDLNKDSGGFSTRGVIENRKRACGGQPKNLGSHDRWRPKMWFYFFLSTRNTSISSPIMSCASTLCYREHDNRSSIGKKPLLNMYRVCRTRLPNSFKPLEYLVQVTPRRARRSSSCMSYPERTWRSEILLYTLNISSILNPQNFRQAS